MTVCNVNRVAYSDKPAGNFNQTAVAPSATKLILSYKCQYHQPHGWKKSCDITYRTDETLWNSMDHIPEHNRGKRRMKIGQTFTRWPKKWLQMNANEAPSLLEV